MSIKFLETGAATAVQIADSDNITIPNGDFTLATLIYTDGVIGGSSQQHLINAGNTFSSGHIALILETGGQVNAQTDVNQSGVSATHQTALAANTAYLIGMQRTGTTVRSFFCPVLQSMPTDGSAVQISTKSRSLNVALNLTTALSIGQRPSAANRATHSMARAFCYVGTLSTLDLAKIAHGMDLLDMGKVPLWYVRMNDGADTADLGPNANPTTRSTGAAALTTGTPITLGYVSTNRPPSITKPVLGSPVQVGTAVGFTSGTADGFPYPTVTQQWLVDGIDVTGATGLTYIPSANDENKLLSVRQTATSQQGVASATSDPVQIIPSVNALYLTPPPTHWMTQHVDGVAPVPFSFTYTGVQPATIEYALYDPDGTLRVNWAAAGATIVPGGTGSATPSMPAGAKKYRLAIRGKNSSGAVLATSATSATTFGVGELIGMVGSSSAETWGYRITGDIDPEICAQHRDGAWYMPDRETYGTRMGRYIRSIRGYVVGIIHAGVGGTGLSGTTGWQAESSSLFQGFKSAVLMSGGKLGGVFISVGSNDAGSGGLINKAVHIASMRSLIQNTRALTGQPNLPVLWSGYNRRAAELGEPNFSASSDAVREAEKVVGNDPNVYHVQALDYELHQDKVHLTGQGFLDCTSRMSYVWCEALAGRYRRGPKISAFSFAGNDVFIDVTHRNGADLSPATGGVGVTVTDASGSPVQVSAQRVSASRYKATYDRPLVAPVVTKFLSGGAPDWLTPIMDNGAVPLPMEVETEMATVVATATPTPDTTAPVMTGSITVSGQTSSGFTMSWAAATDNTGVASYEADNGSGTYVNIGNVLTLAVTGKSAATSYPVRVRALDAAGNAATPLTATAVTTATADTTAPVMTGSITVSAITTSGATISCSAAADGVGVTGYEYSINGGTSYTLIASGARSVAITGRPEGTEHQVRMRAVDAAGNRATPLSATFTTAVTPPVVTPPAPGAVLASTVAESRRVAFPGGTRVVRFGSQPSSVTPNAPYLQAGKWWTAKHPLDERYWVADITIDLAERGTTATSVVAIEAGVTVLEQPVIQGKLIAVKLGGFNATPGAANFCTFRVTCANGERFDRTISFKQQVGVYSLSKDADDQSYYVGDIGNDLVDSNTTASAVLALPVGVEVLVPAVIQGPLILVKLGGMDTLPSGVNYCDLRIDCANGERFYRTIQFNRVDN